MSLLALNRRLDRLESAYRKPPEEPKAGVVPQLTREQRHLRIRFLLNKLMLFKQLEPSFENRVAAVSELFQRHGRSTCNGRRMLSGLYSDHGPETPLDFSGDQDPCRAVTTVASSESGARAPIFP